VSPRQWQQSQTRREELLSPKGKSTQLLRLFVRVDAFGCVPDGICKVRKGEVISSNQVREIGRGPGECKADFAAVHYLCVPRIRFGNIGGEVHRGPAVK
jgi:hypothetical protein